MVVLKQKWFSRMPEEGSCNASFNSDCVSSFDNYCGKMCILVYCVEVVVVSGKSAYGWA